MTRKNIEYFYENILTILKWYNPVKAVDFVSITKAKSPKDVYLWLDTEFGEESLPTELEEIMKDFFFSIH